MADNFGLKIGVEGEKEFKNALRDINQSFKVLGSEMALVTSQFDKNDKSAAALTSRNTVLNKEIDAQKEKVKALEAALKNASESFGENDRRTQNWQIQLNKAQAELNGMERELEQSTVEADNLGEELNASGKSADDAGGKFDKLGGILGGHRCGNGCGCRCCRSRCYKVRQRGCSTIWRVGTEPRWLGGSFRHLRCIDSENR
jgi:hypothetical protein